MTLSEWHEKNKVLKYQQERIVDDEKGYWDINLNEFSSESITSIKFASL